MQQIDEAQLIGKVDPLGIAQEIKIWPYKYAQIRICSSK